MEPEKKRKKNPWRFAFLLAAVAGGSELLGELISWLLYRAVGNVTLGVSEASTLGIIGGADGPTAIFVTYGAPSVGKLLTAALLLGIGLWGYRRLKMGKDTK